MTNTARFARNLGVFSAIVLGTGLTACSSSDPSVVDQTQLALGSTTGIIKGLGGKCLDSGGTASGSRARLWTCNGAATQQWTVSNGRILGPGGKCLDVSGNVSANGTPLILWDCWGGPNQQWSFAGSAIVGLDGKCVDVTRSDTADGTPIILWDCHGRTNQQWSFVPSGTVADAGTATSDAATADAAPPPDAGTTAPPPSTRDPLKWPFASTSIWNMPIGSGAVFAPANLVDDPEGNVWSTMPGVDDEAIVLRPNAPMTNVSYSSAGWSGANRCNATGGLLATVPMPSDFIQPNGNGNVGASFLMPDGRTIVQMQPLARCTAGGPGTALVTFPNVDLFGDGTRGAHGGSGLSAIGGSLRVGELRPGTTGPRHALKVNVDAKAELYRCTTRSDCFRWPAPTADSYAVGRYGTANPNAGNAAMKMGSLLAIPGSTSIASLGLETEPAKLLAWTLQNYGAYIVDDTWAPGFDFSAEAGADGVFRDQFQKDWGFSFRQRVNDGSPWVRDIQRLRRAMRVVDNNAPTSVGGGGTPRQPLAPPL